MQQPRKQILGWGRLKNLGLLTLFFLSALISVLHALSASRASGSFVQLVNEGESRLAWMYNFETSKNGDSPATAGNSCLTNSAILSSTAEFLGDRTVAFSDTKWAILSPRPILTINKEDNPPDNVQPGAALTYTITYSNIGNAHATGVSIIDIFDNNVTFERSSPSPTGGAENVRYWQIGGLKKGAHGNITAMVRVSTSAVSGTVLTNLAQINSSETEVVSDTETTTVVCPTSTLTINKEDNPPDNVQPGAALTYTITYSNIGNAHATGVSIIDIFDNNVTFERSSPSPTGGAENVRYWQIGGLKKGAHGNITAMVRVSTSAVSGTVLTNLAQIDSPDAKMTSSTETTTVFTESREIYLPIVTRDYCPDNYEPNDTRLVTQAELTSGMCIVSKICPDDKDDFYYINVETPTRIAISLTDFAPDYDLYLYNSPTRSNIARSNTLGDGVPESIIYPQEPGQKATPGIYYIRVYTLWQIKPIVPGSYKLCVTF